MINLWMAGWNTYAKSWEVALAAPVVIGIRTSRMMASPWPSTEADQREFDRMGSEKVEVFSESAVAMGSRLFEANAQLMSYTFKQWSQIDPVTFWSAVFGSPAALKRLGQAGDTKGATRTARAYHRAVDQGLNPIHRSVTRNAKRLSRG
jgi:hypothetical protein